MSTIQITPDEITSAIQSALRDVVRGRGILLDATNGDRLKHIAESTSAGVVDYFRAKGEETTPSTEPQDPIPGKYPLIIGSYHFNVSNASWDSFKESVALLASVMCLVGGQPILGALSVTVSLRELARILAENLQDLSLEERHIAESVVKLRAETGADPSIEMLKSELRANIAMKPAEIAKGLQSLVEAGVLQLSSTTPQSVGLVF